MHHFVGTLMCETAGMHCAIKTCSISKDMAARAFAKWFQHSFVAILRHTVLL
jgi:hypothetical protein